MVIILGCVELGIHSILSKQEIIKNLGVSFGWQVNVIVVVVFWVVLLIYLTKVWNWGLVMVAVGGLVNLADRLLLGYVRDYWKIPTINLVNNLNDWLVGVGVVFFLISIWWKKK
jgi:lipoprotein signal peptidase